MRRVVVGGVFPGEVAGVEEVELAVREPVVEEFGVLAGDVNNTGSLWPAVAARGSVSRVSGIAGG